MKSTAPAVAEKLVLPLYILLMLTPLWILTLDGFHQGTIDSGLYSEAVVNTFLLAIAVLTGSTILGVGCACMYSFYCYSFRRTLHILIMMPLAFPAYVIAFIYLGAFGPSSVASLAGFAEIQGELWFLAFILILALTPYIYFFSNIGFAFVRQSEVETEAIIQGGRIKFFRYNVFPKLVVFLISAQVLVLFETLSDFGAASIVNVPVMTTMIYKAWYDLFSFESAVQISLKYSFVILLLLGVEYFLKRNTVAVGKSNSDPLKRGNLPNVLKCLGLPMMLSYIVLGFLFPLFQILSWVGASGAPAIDSRLVDATLVTMGLGVSVGILVVAVSLCLTLLLRFFRQKSEIWIITSTIGYSVPGAILAVSAYTILLLFFPQVSSLILFFALIIALSYKFLTVALRPIGESVDQLPIELDETSRIMGVGLRRRIRYYLFPYLKESLVVGLLLVMIEVMKEMPLTLMLAPGEYQTLSIQIFNFTSEGEWGKASLPSLVLILVGIFSVAVINFRQVKR